MLCLRSAEAETDLLDMPLNVRDLNGIFKVEYHNASIRFIWLVSVITSFFAIVFGGWAAKVDLFNFSQHFSSKYFEIALAILFLGVLPAFIFIIGLIKLGENPGMILKGIRIVDNGVEIGVFTLDVNFISTQEIWENRSIANDKFGEWKQNRKINNKAINILIVLRKLQELPNRLLLERIILSSREECLFELFGHNSSGTSRNDIVALSQGTISLIGNDDGIFPDDPVSFREQTADIVSRWKPRFALSCTLKTLPGLANIESVLAFGVLGGISATGSKSASDNVYIEKIFDNFSNKKNSSADLDQNRS